MLEHQLEHQPADPETQPESVFRRRETLASVYLLLSGVGVIIDLSIQPLFRELDESGKATAFQSLLLRNVLDLVGDVSNTFWFGIVAFCCDCLFEEYLRTRKSKRFQRPLEKLRQTLPFVMCTLFLLAVIDTETPGGLINWGKPYLQDTFAGFFGIITGALTYDSLQHWKKMFQSESS